MDEQEDAPAPAKGATDRDSDKAENSQLAKWLRELTALAGLIAVVAGSWVSVESLRQKAETDKKTAEIQQNLAQLQAQQHQKDVEMQQGIHDADLKNKKDEATAQDARERNQRLADVVSRLFDGKSGSEGDLAILSQFLSADAESRQIVENAVLARLETPRTKEEIDLGFRLYEQIGPSAWSYVAQVNRSARRRYDECLFARFSSEFNKRASKEVNPELASPRRLIARIGETEAGILNTKSLDEDYNFATLNRKIQSSPGSVIQVAPELAGLESDALRAQQSLAADEISRSNQALRGYLGKHHGELPEHMDLSGTYLENGTVFDPYHGILPAIANAYTSGAYLSRVDARELKGFLYDSPEFSRVATTPDVIESTVKGSPCTSVSYASCSFHAFAPEVY
jgi:hypothetical protein